MSRIVILTMNVHRVAELSALAPGLRYAQAPALTLSSAFYSCLMRPSVSPQTPEDRRVKRWNTSHRSQ